MEIKIEEMRNELRDYLVESSSAGNNAGEYPISEEEAEEIVDGWDDDKVRIKYKYLEDYSAGTG